MDIEEFELRISQIITETGMQHVASTNGRDTLDVTARVEKFDELERDLIAAISRSDTPEALQEFLEMFLSIRRSLSDPNFLKPMSGAEGDLMLAQPPIFGAVESEDVEAVRAALMDWDVNAQAGTYGSSALYHAMTVTWGPSLQVINCLLDAGADPKRGLGDTNVLHGLGFPVWRDVTAVELSEVVKRCIALGANIEERTETLGWTPLILAVSEWNEVATEALLLAGADPHVRAEDTGRGCFSGADCLTIANGHHKTTAILRTFMVRN